MELDTHHLEMLEIVFRSLHAIGKGVLSVTICR